MNEFLDKQVFMLSVRVSRPSLHINTLGCDIKYTNNKACFLCITFQKVNNWPQ